MNDNFLKVVSYKEYLVCNWVAKRMFLCSISFRQEITVLHHCMEIYRAQGSHWIIFSKEIILAPKFLYLTYVNYIIKMKKKKYTSAILGCFIAPRNRKVSSPTGVRNVNDLHLPGTERLPSWWIHHPCAPCLRFCPPSAHHPDLQPWVTRRNQQVSRWTMPFCPDSSMKNHPKYFPKHPVGQCLVRLSAPNSLWWGRKTRPHQGTATRRKGSAAADLLCGHWVRKETRTGHCLWRPVMHVAPGSLTRELCRCTSVGTPNTVRSRKEKGIFYTHLSSV